MAISDIIALASAGIALAALGTAVWNSQVVIRHQKLSVKPHLQIDFHFATDEDVGIYLTSNGLGPAKYVSMTWRTDQMDYPIDTPKKYLRIVKALGLEHLTANYLRPQDGSFFEPGKSKALLVFPGTANSPNHGQVVDALYGLTFEISYESLYGETYSGRYGRGV